jgi:hypothetical protein
MSSGQAERSAYVSIDWSSITLASVAAGPLFLLGIGIGLLADDPGAARTIDLTGSMILGVPVIMPLTAVFGAIVALPPNLLGASLMTWLGNRNEAARLPMMWGLAGALTCAFFVAAAGAGPAGGHSVTLVAFTFTGACCALICRRRIKWDAEPQRHEAMSHRPTRLSCAKSGRTSLGHTCNRCLSAHRHAAARMARGAAHEPARSLA